ncbi:TPA: hypothetical protein ACKPZF_005281 [Pseudomonas aeruginosa]
MSDLRGRLDARVEAPGILALEERLSAPSIFTAVRIGKRRLALITTEKCR